MIVYTKKRCKGQRFKARGVGVYQTTYDPNSCNELNSPGRSSFMESV